MNTARPISGWGFFAAVAEFPPHHPDSPVCLAHVDSIHA
jgi:hypothetical protein